MFMWGWRGRGYIGPESANSGHIRLPSLFSMLDQSKGYLVSIMIKLLSATLLALMCSYASAAPQDAERFTHIAGFNLEELYSFDDLAGKFGKSKIDSSGDASNYEARVCYKASDGKAIIIFFHGEVDWGFTIRKPIKSDSQCPKSNALTPSKINVAGISLGMGKSEYIKLVGKPQSSNAEHIKHEFQYVHTLTDQELKEMREKSLKNGYKENSPEEWRKWDVIISLDATFEENHLTAITIYRVETN